jgi:hypothetical protein
MSFCCANMVWSRLRQTRNLFWSVPGWSGRLLAPFVRAFFVRRRGGIATVGFPFVLSCAGIVVVYVGMMALLFLLSFPFRLWFPSGRGCAGVVAFAVLFVVSLVFVVFVFGSGGRCYIGLIGF